MRSYKNIVHELFDEFTGEEISYKQVTTWVDGTPMSTAKCDGVVFRMRVVHGEPTYYKRDLPLGMIKVEWYGILPNGQDQLLKFKTLIDFYHVPQTFLLPVGFIFLSDVLIFQDREHTLIGQGAQVSGFRIAAGKSGLVATRASGAAGYVLRDFSVICEGKDLEAGRLPAGTYPNATYSSGVDGDNSLAQINQRVVPDYFLRETPLPGGIYPNAEWPAGTYHQQAGTEIRFPSYSENAYSTNFGEYGQTGLGIYATARCYNIVVSNFGIGVNTYGNVLDKSLSGAGYDASRCYFESVSVQGCTFGWVNNGADSNQSTFIGCEVRNSEVYGVLNNGFLGDHYLHFHAIENRCGHYILTNANARHTLVGCYGESGNFFGIDRPSRAVGFAQIDGGIHASGWIAGNNVSIQEGSAINVVRTAKVELGGKLVFTTTPFELQPMLNGGNGLGFGATFNDSLFQVFTTGNTINSLRGFRDDTEQGMNINNLYVNGSLRGAIANIENLALYKGVEVRNTARFQAGDQLDNALYNGTNPTHWTCIIGGTNAVYTEGLTITEAFGGNYDLSGPTTVLKPGMTISFNGRTAIITGFSTPTRMEATTERDSGTAMTPNMAISYPKAVWKAMGQGAGSTGQRPTLRLDDAGWPYWNTTTNTLQHWSGTTWI